MDTFLLLLKNVRARITALQPGSSPPGHAPFLCSCSNRSRDPLIHRSNYPFIQLSTHPTTWHGVHTLRESPYASSIVRYASAATQSRMSDILLIQGSALDADETEALLRTLGIKNPVRRFSDGTATMNLLRALAEDPNGVPPGIILLDVTLPDLSGFEILRWMREQKTFKHTLKIVLSTLDEIGTIKQAYELGANSFLNKPVRIDDLRELVETYPQHWLIDGSGQQAVHTD